jgi:hypothetical protein
VSISCCVVTVALFVVVVLDSLLEDRLRHKASDRDVRVVAILAVVAVCNSDVSFCRSSSSSSSSFIAFLLDVWWHKLWISYLAVLVRTCVFLTARLTKAKRF